MSQVWQAHTTADGQTYYYNLQTGESSWDVPAELQSAEDRDAGDLVWIPDADAGGFSPGTVQATTATGARTCRTLDGRELTVKRGVALDALKKSSLSKNVPDLVQLDSITPGQIAHNLKTRFENNEIYTSVGTILISINPYKMLPIYTPSKIQEYARKGTTTLPPHVYDIAANAYTKIVEEKKSQSILVSGESGAGKTEATKQVLQFLAEVAGSTTGVEQRILKANPVLEALGNAKTLRNNNSSRFGKYIEVEFDGRGRVCGASIQSYLLEKSRVVFQTPDERNYHIFYFLLAGATEEQRGRLYLAGPEYFRYTQGCTTIPGLDDRSEYLEVLQAMRELGFSDAEVDNAMQIVAAVLYIGNIDFTDADASQVANPDVLAIAAHLLEVPQDGLAHALTSRVMNIPGQESTTIPLSRDQCYHAANALAKTVYGNLFDWTVAKINEATRNTANERMTTIGVLDIFGFEIFENNSFEQLCINFANEKLQQLFNATTFKREEQLYESEGIQFTHVEFIDNQPMLDLIEKKPAGILFLADEETVVPRGTDESLLNKLHNMHDGKHPKYKKPLRPRDAFVVEHYAGAVTYCVTGFLEKTRDTLMENLAEIMTSTGNALLGKLFAVAPDRGARRATLGSQFRQQLSALMTTLGSTDSHFIRCIKPNPNKRPGEFHAQMSLEQMTYAGVFEAVRIRKTGYPFRYTHKEFVQRYRILAPTACSGQDYKASCASLLGAVKGDVTDVQIGRTRVLYKAGPHRNLELARSVAQHYAVRKIQRVVKRWLRDKALRDILTQYFGGNPGPMLDQMKRTLNDLADAVEQFDVEGMDYHIAAAEQMNLGEFDSVVSAREYRDYCYYLRQEAWSALEELDRERMEAALQSYEQLGWENEYRTKLHELLVLTPRDKFLQLQLKLATKRGETEKATAKTIEIKTDFLTKNRANFTMDQYEGWKPIDTFAKAKLFGRDELKAGMKVWTKKVIPTSLTRLAPGEQTSMAVKCFKNLLGFTGERSYSYPTVLLRENIETAMNVGALRDELYVQVLKQLDRNPDASSKEKNWRALRAYVTYFPPSNGFANFIEVYLMDANRQDLITAMHGPLYGERKPVPAVEELAALIA